MQTSRFFFKNFKKLSFLQPFACVYICLVISSSSFAQSELSGINQYPQYRTVSGLPGGMFGISKAGKCDFGGAVSISTPVGYTLGSRQYAFGISNTSASHHFTFFDHGGENTSNGTGFAMAGFTLPVGNLTLCYEVLSTRGDQAYNLQFSPKLKGSPVGISLGVQDAGSHGGASGESIDLVNPMTSRSYYIAATRDFGRGLFATVGTGDHRFRKVWGNVSGDLYHAVKGIAEYDGFNWNAGVAINLVTNEFGRYSPTLFLGTIRMKYPTWGLTVAF